MARKERNKVDYFPHPVNHGKKMSYLEKKYQNDGYAVWFKILEELGDADYHYLDLKKEVQIMFLSDRCVVTEERLLSIINDLITLEEFDKELWEKERIIFSEKFVESISDAYKKRNNNCIDKNSLLLLLKNKSNPKQDKSNPKPTKKELQGGRNTQRIEKDRKEKDRREKSTSQISEDLTAYELIKKEKPSLLQAFEMKTKNQILNWDKLITSFEDKIELEIAQNKINWDSKELFPRFKGFVNNWISNDHSKLLGNYPADKNNPNPSSKIPIG